MTLTVPSRGWVRIELVLVVSEGELMPPVKSYRKVVCSSIEITFKQAALSKNNGLSWELMRSLSLEVFKQRLKSYLQEIKCRQSSTSRWLVS